jgi:homocysteine S-methyltransferase
MHISPLLPLSPFPCLVLDGGLATELEKRGHNLDDPLWSARLLLSEPEAIQQLHTDYLVAGADIIITASYQATIPGLMARGLDETAARALIQKSVELAIAARDQFWPAAASEGRIRPLVAASVGPYGAYLADGSEYDGRYGLSEDELYQFHRERWLLLAGTAADLLACETIPSYLEARALARLLVETPARLAWFAFSCADGRQLHDGAPIRECAAFLDGVLGVAAIGVNCTPPEHITSLIQEIRAVSQKPIVVYPNSGETYDAVHNCWLGDPQDFLVASRAWLAAGASLIGGCCRVGPEQIRQLRDRLYDGFQ